MKKGIKIILSLCLIIILIVLVMFLFYKNNLESVSKNSNIKEVTIEKGMSANSISKVLYDNGIIKNADVFKLYVKLNKINNLKAGTYDFDTQKNVKEIVEQLQSGPDNTKNTINITILEGKNMRWIAKTISEKTNISEDEVLQKTKDQDYLNRKIAEHWFLTDYIKDNRIYYPLEGYLFPDTYNFDKDVTIEKIFDTMLDEMDKKLTPYKDKINQTGIPIHQIITIASIIECESSNPDDMKNVSSVIYNRLRSNMVIGSDVTTYYGIGIDVHERDLKQSEINQLNAYNTRAAGMEGQVPVSPISTISINSLEASIEPAQTDYLYFVADKNGKIYFSRNSEEHNSMINELKNEGLWYNY